MTRRPVAASAGPIRHQIRAEAVTPWIRTSGRPVTAPQAIEEKGIPAASVVVRWPGSGGSASSADETAAGRSARVATIGTGSDSSTTATVAR